MIAARTPTARVSSWLLARRLYRRTTSEVAAGLARVVLIRTWAAACAFGSMVLLAWIAAFARGLFGHGWHGFRALDAAGLSSASMQAGRYAGDLVPVLVVWAALLLLAPAGSTLAFDGTAVAAGVLGALDFSPPSFLVTPKVAGFAGEVVRFSHGWNWILLLVTALLGASLLHHGAVRAFGLLDEFSARQTRYPARAARFVLALVVLVSAAWSGAVVWLAASHAHGDAASYGFSGTLVLSNYLLALTVVAVLVPRGSPAQGWLVTVTLLAALLGTVPGNSYLAHHLAVPIGRGELERIHPTWGGSLWAALFIGFPVCLLGAYLMARVRRLRSSLF
jgi:hypothetical protein